MRLCSFLWNLYLGFYSQAWQASFSLILQRPTPIRVSKYITRNDKTIVKRWFFVCSSPVFIHFILAGAVVLLSRMPREFKHNVALILSNISLLPRQSGRWRHSSVIECKQSIMPLLWLSPILQGSHTRIHIHREPHGFAQTHSNTREKKHVKRVEISLCSSLRDFILKRLIVVY